MAQDKLHVAFCGLSGFPVSNRASVNKMTNMAKGLIDAGADARIVCRKGVAEKGEVEDVPNGVSQGIPYYTATGTLMRPTGFLQRNILKNFSAFKEYRILARMKKEAGLDVVVLDTPYLRTIRLFRLFSRLLGFKLVYHYVEMRSHINAESKGFWKKREHRIMDEKVTTFFDAIMPISSVLEDWVIKKDPTVPMFRLPVLADYNFFDRPKTLNDAPYYLYCGSAAYSEVIYFILDAFDQLDASNDMELHFVISGPQHKKDEVFDRIADSPKADKIKTFSRIPYEELADRYVSAQALLIPLRDTVQDKARFPFKVGEYLATHNPVITTNYGELATYFEDMDTALVADSYDLDLYKEKLQLVYEQPELVKEVGQRGYELGRENFHYARTGERMRDFFAKLVGKPVPQAESRMKETA